MPFSLSVASTKNSCPAAEETPAEPAAAAHSPTGTAAAAKKAPSKKAGLTTAEERGSALQKIAKLDIKDRIQLAMKGTKEERSLLIRDGTKIVALAVLESPKVSDGEVEKFAGQKNVLEAVLRGIPMKRRFAKNYSIVRALVFNPRTPLDLALGLMKNMLVSDLRNLSNNKEVSDTVRKLATKMFKQKMESNSGKKCTASRRHCANLWPGSLLNRYSIFECHPEAQRGIWCSRPPQPVVALARKQVPPLSLASLRFGRDDRQLDDRCVEARPGANVGLRVTIPPWLPCRIPIPLPTCSSDPEPSRWSGSPTARCAPAMAYRPTCRRRAIASSR